MTVGYPETMVYGQSTDALFVEYVKRSKPFSMADNHYHSFYELYVLLSGERQYFIKDRLYPVGQGNLVFIGKHELHKTLNHGERGHERVLIHFDERFLAGFSDEQAALLLTSYMQDHRVLQLPGADQLRVDAQISTILAELQNQSDGYEMALSSAVKDLLLTAARYLKKHPPVSPVYEESPIQQKISEVVRHLNEHYAEPYDLDSLARQFYISPFYLSRRFKEMTGFSIVEYVNLNRVREAQRLLRETELSITEIAALAGFESFPHFGKTFKKIARTSPREYRKLYYSGM
jgi:AraC-like DNA-binding protein